MYKLNFFKQRPNNRFNYTPRYFKGKDLGNPYDFDSSMRKHRESVNVNDRRQLWADARQQSRSRRNSGSTKTILIIAVLLLFLCMWVLDLDWSTFKF
ncbi:MAG: hypothetical protein ACON42_03955 [Flavobacteriaceae bacterium]